MAQTGKRRRKPRPGLIRRTIRGVAVGVLRLLWWVGIRTAVLGGIVLAVATAYYVTRIPDIDELLDPLLSQFSDVFARDIVLS